MEEEFEQIFQQLKDPPLSCQSINRVTADPIFQKVLKDYSERFCKELAIFLVHKMHKGNSKASLLFHKLLRSTGQRVPNEVLLIKEHSGNNFRENFNEEWEEYYLEHRFDENLPFDTETMFRAERILNSQWIHELSLPIIPITLSMKNLSI